MFVALGSGRDMKWLVPHTDQLIISCLIHNTHQLKLFLLVTIVVGC